MIVMGITSPGFVIRAQTRILMGVNSLINYEISNGMRLIGGLFIILHLCFLITIIMICQKFIVLVEDVV